MGRDNKIERQEIINKFESHKCSWSTTAVAGSADWICYVVSKSTGERLAEARAIGEWNAIVAASNLLGQTEVPLSVDELRAELAREKAARAKLESELARDANEDDTLENDESYDNVVFESVDEMKALLDDHGIEYDGRIGKAKLKSLILEHKLV